jgi:hypothetical protein
VQRATDPDQDPTTDDAVDVINMSLGFDGNPDSPLAQAVDAAVDEGVVAAVSAGNDGPEYQTVHSPGLARKALTVGSSTKSDAISSFSARGPVTDFWELIKPNIVAPGSSISSTDLDGGYSSRSGTSMAAPHIAGSAALIKQLHPSWSPEMIQANLMNSAKDLGEDVLTQGAGRVQVDDAANAKAVLTPGSVGFGLVDTEQPVWSKSETLCLTNVSTASQQYSLQVNDTLPDGVTTHIDPTSVTVEPGESISVTFAISVDNSLLPFPEQKPYTYEGKVTAQAGGQGQATAQGAASPVSVPFAFIRSSQLEISFGGRPDLVVVHDGQEAWEMPSPGTSVRLLAAPGTYDVWVIYTTSERWDTWVIREDVVVGTSPTSLSVQPSDAIHAVILAPRDKDGEPIPSGYHMLAQRFRHTPSGISVGRFDRYTPSLTRHFSDVSADYAWEWRMNAQWQGVYYGFYGKVTDIDSDLTWQNAPGDLWHIQHQCHPPPGHSQLQLLFYLPYG